MTGGRRIEQRAPAESLISWTVAVADYDGRMKDIIHALKYDRRRTISPRLGALMRNAATELLRDAYCVVPVPLHPRREYMRGFNQARDLGLHLGPPVIDALRRVRHTASQIDLPRDERKANVTGAFVWRPTPGSRLPPLDLARGGPELVEGPVPGIVVLVDDVSTTGATLESCARVMKDAGVAEVRAVTAARVVNARR